MYLTGADGIDVREEILADFTGDALADPQFLQALATNNSTKVRLFVKQVLNWLKDFSVMDKSEPMSLCYRSRVLKRDVLFPTPLSEDVCRVPGL